MGLVQEGTRRRLAGVFRRQMKQPTPAAVTEEGHIISTGPLVVGRLIFDRTVTATPAEPELTVIPNEIVVLDATESIESRRNVYGRGRKGKPGKLPAGSSASVVGNAGLTTVGQDEELEELREEITLEGVEARTDRVVGKTSKRKRSGEMLEKQRKEIIGKIPQVGDEELEEARGWNRQAIERFMKSLLNQTDVVYNKSKALARIAMFIAQASRRSLEKFDPELPNLMEFQVKRALGICSMLIGSHRGIDNLAKLFEVTKRAVNQNPFYFWENEVRD